jgi:demethylmenaquinone methyltransferase/2-methoxy-6-polyprenyl-1,4-benzoquinol methylase
VVGLELSPAMLGIAQRKNHFANAVFMAGDATALPFPAGRFDLACISFALHEMPATIRERVLLEMMRVTRPGGRIVVVDYALPRNAVGRWLVFHLVKLYERDHYAEFVRADLPALLRRMGLEPLAEQRALLGAARIVIATTISTA